MDDLRPIQTKKWNTRYLELRLFRKHNPGRWPVQRCKEPLEHKLGVWMLAIRKNYKNGTLSAERVRKLNDIYFPFYPNDDRWQRSFIRLTKWIEKNGCFPNQRQSNSEKERSLFTWCVSNQKNTYRGL